MGVLSTALRILEERKGKLEEITGGEGKRVPPFYPCACFGFKPKAGCNIITEKKEKSWMPCNGKRMSLSRDGFAISPCYVESAAFVS